MTQKQPLNKRLKNSAECCRLVNMTDPYRELATVVQDPIAAEFDRIDAEKDQEAKKKLDRVLKHMVFQYAKETPKADGHWYLVDPGANWWNFKRAIPSFEWDTTFGYLLEEHCKDLNIVIDSEEIKSPYSLNSIKILTWKFETDDNEEETAT